MSSDSPGSEDSDGKEKEIGRKRKKPLFSKQTQAKVLAARRLPLDPDELEAAVLSSDSDNDKDYRPSSSGSDSEPETQRHPLTAEALKTAILATLHAQEETISSSALSEALKLTFAALVPAEQPLDVSMSKRNAKVTKSEPGLKLLSNFKSMTYPHLKPIHNWSVPFICTCILS